MEKAMDKSNTFKLNNWPYCLIFTVTIASSLYSNWFYVVRLVLSYLYNTFDFAYFWRGLL